MDGLLHTKSLRVLWTPVLCSMKQVLRIPELLSVEESAYAEVPFESFSEDCTWNHKEAELQEALDDLHVCLTTIDCGISVESSSSLPAVRRTYLALCRAFLRAEAVERARGRKFAKDSLAALDCLQRPISNSWPKLEVAVEKIRQCAVWLRIRAANVAPPGLSSRMFLLADQAISGLRLLLQAVRNLELDPNILATHATAGFDHVIKCLRWCLNEVLSTETMQQEHDQAECGKFVKLMDEVLGIIERTGELTDTTYATCEELLGHAMSVAHVAVNTDAESITSAAQTVLKRVQAARGEVNRGMLALRLGSLEDALLCLERIVNTTLLRLVLEVFSDADGQLNQLLTATPERSCLVEAFDLHVERVMQAGLFAVACSSDAQRVAGVRSCLASLECLETELVPSVLACDDHKLAQFYANHWRREVSRLAEFLDQMLDPIAFCQVTAEELTRLQDLLIKTYDEHLESETKSVARAMVKRAEKIIRFVRSLTERGEVSLSCDAQVLDDIAFYANELNAAFRSPRGEKWHRRISQRARILTIQVRALAVQLQERDVSSNDGQVSYSEEQNKEKKNDVNSDSECQQCTPVKNIGTPRPHKPIVMTPSFPDSVHGLPLDVTTSEGTVDMTPFVARGRRLCDSRNILYRTPQRTDRSAKLVALTPAPENAKGLQLFKEQTLGLNITELLDGISVLTEMSNTLPSEIIEISRPMSRGTKIGASLRLPRDHLELIAAVPSLLLSPSLSSQIVSASQREADLQYLDEKIKHLKKEVKNDE